MLRVRGSFRWNSQHRRRLGFLIAPALGLLLSPAMASFAKAGDWSYIGPNPLGNGWTGRVSAVAVSPEDKDVFYVASASGGIWRHDGKAWKALTESLPVAAMGAVAVAPGDAQRIYAGSGEANYAHHSFYGLGFLRSKDGGESWDLLGKKTFAGRTFSKIVVSSKDPDVVFASVMHAGGFPAKVAAKGHPRTNDPVGIYRSTDGGERWKRLTQGLPGDVAASDVAIDPNDPKILYAALGDPFGHPDNGIFKSTDGGDSWKKLRGGLPKNPGRISLAIGTSDSKRLYALTTAPSNDSGGGASTQGVYRSDDGGQSWKRTDPGGIQSSYGWFLSAAAVNPKNADIAIFGGVNAARTTNGGSSYTDATPPHVDIHAFVYDISGRLLVGDDGGLHRSENDGASWKAINKGLTNTQLYGGLALHSGKRHWIAGGFQDNGSNVCQDAKKGAWKMVLGGDGGPMASHPDAPNIVFAQSQRMSISRSTNGGRSFRRISGVSGTNAFFSPITFAPSNAKRVYIGAQRLFRSDDSGASFKAVGSSLGSGSKAARAIAVAPSDPNVVYVSTTGGKVFASEDGGNSLKEVLSGVDGFQRTTKELAVSPLDPKVVYLGVGQFGRAQVLRSDDGGKKWKEVDSNLPDIPINAVAVAKADTESGTIVVVGSDQKVYLSCNEGGHWRRLGDKLPTVPISDVMIDSNFDRIVIATMGRGTWEIDLPELPGEICDPPGEGGGDDTGEDEDEGGSSGEGGGDDGDDGPGGSSEGGTKSGSGTVEPGGGDSGNDTSGEDEEPDDDDSPQDTSGEDSSDPQLKGAEAGGCQCRSSANSPHLAWLALFGLWAWRRRRA